jgi:hypothetical protein
MTLAWPLAVRWPHDACVEAVFDQASSSLGRDEDSSANRPAWTRTLLAMMRLMSLVGARTARTPAKRSGTQTSRQRGSA